MANAQFASVTRIMFSRRRQYHLELYDARQQPELIHHLREQGYDINDGMILLIHGQIYHKQDALSHASNHARK